MSIEAMRMALAGIRWHLYGECYTEGWNAAPRKLGDVAVALEQAIEQDERNDFNPDWDAMATLVEENQRLAKQLAEMKDWEDIAADRAMTIAMIKQREWIGLTEDDIDDIWDLHCDEVGDARQEDAMNIANAIEAKLKEKNHG